MKAVVILAMASGLVAAAGKPSASFFRPPMPVCAELTAATPVELAGYLEKSPKGSSPACTEFAIRRLEAATDQMSIVDSTRALNALVPFLDFESQTVRKSNWYPARNAIVAVTNAAVQTMEDAHQDPVPVRQPIVEKLIAAVSDATVSEIAANNAAWALEQIMAFPKAPSGTLPAVRLLASAARESTDASSSKRLWDEAKKLADTCASDELEHLCTAALN